MASTRFGHVDDGGAIKNRPITFGNRFQFRHQCLYLLHVMFLDCIPHLLGISNLSTMANLMNTGFGLIFRQGRDVST